MNDCGLNEIDLLALLTAAGTRHMNICPRQILGVRMGLYAGDLLELELPRRDKRVLVIVETDGCFLDGVIAATHCHPGRRTLRVEDYGKVAATFIDTQTGKAVRLAPAPGCRQRALDFAPHAPDRWEGQLTGYQRMPAAELFSAVEVELAIPLAQILSLPGTKTVCTDCGEEILNGREVISGSRTLCKPCAGTSYYISADLNHPTADET